MRRIAILGSTGSIGTSALSVVDTHADRLHVVALAAGNNVAVLAEQVARYRPRVVALASEAGLDRLRREAGTLPQALCGPEGLLAVATHPDVDLVLCASSGTMALEAVLAAIDCGKTSMHSLNDNDKTYVFVGKCDMIAVAGNNNKVTVESAKAVSVDGNNNKVDIVAVDLLATPGNNNAVSYKKAAAAAKVKLTNTGNGNKVSLTK